jgi:PhnB protein
MKVQPYLFFGGNCEEAIGFYSKVLGAEVTMLMRYRESPDPPPPGMVAPGSEDKILHASLRLGETELMASDGMSRGDATFSGVSLAFSVATEAEADRVFAALADGGQIQMPIGRTFFSPRFGMLADKFGVNWMIMAEPAA